MVAEKEPKKASSLMPGGMGGMGDWITERLLKVVEEAVCRRPSRYRRLGPLMDNYYCEAYPKAAELVIQLGPQLTLPVMRFDWINNRRC